MAGTLSGVQARISLLNPKAIFIPCTSHPLNLCGVHSFATNSTCVSFFGTVEAIYNFFSASTRRWEILMKSTTLTVKRLCETRWSAHYNAIHALFKNYLAVINTLEDMIDSGTENIDTRSGAHSLLGAIRNFGFFHIYPCGPLCLKK